MSNNKKSTPPIRREDHAGHLDPKHAASLRAKGAATQTKDDNRAFVGAHNHRDELAQELGSEAVIAMTSAEDDLTDDLAREVTEETGGPFVVTSAATEFAAGTDKSNPKGAKKAPFPRV
jgi:hypothetical protein